MPHVVLQRASVLQELNIRAVRSYTTLLPLLDIFLPSQWRETPVLAHNDLLSARELVLRATESLDSGGAVGVTSSHGENDLTDVDAGNGAVGLAERTTHAGLESISSGTR